MLKNYIALNILKKVSNMIERSQFSLVTILFNWSPQKHHYLKVSAMEEVAFVLEIVKIFWIFIRGMNIAL